MQRLPRDLPGSLSEGSGHHKGPALGLWMPGQCVCREQQELKEEALWQQLGSKREQERQLSLGLGGRPVQCAVCAMVGVHPGLREGSWEMLGDSGIAAVVDSPSRGPVHIPLLWASLQGQRSL